MIIWTSSAARMGLLFASGLAIAISNLGKRIIPADDSLKKKCRLVMTKISPLNSQAPIIVWCMDNYNTKSKQNWSYKYKRLTSFFNRLGILKYKKEMVFFSIWTLLISWEAFKDRSSMKGIEDITINSRIKLSIARKYEQSQERKTGKFESRNTSMPYLISCKTLALHSWSKKHQPAFMSVDIPTNVHFLCLY